MDKTEKFYERVVLAMLIALFSFLMYAAGGSDDSLAGDDIASMDMPKILFGLLLVLCAVKLIGNVFQGGAVKEGKKTDRRVYITMALIVAYAFGFDAIGFCASTFLFVLITAQVLRPANSWKSAAAISLLVTVVTYFIFGTLFGVYFPEPIYEMLRG